MSRRPVSFFEIATRSTATIRRECLDHIIPLGEGHLRRVLREYVAY